MRDAGASRPLVLVVIAVAALIAGCKGRSAGAPADPPEPTPVERGQADADDCAPDGPGAVKWIHDDYPRAVRCARRLGKALVVDLWAPWCHTCLSMKQTVLVDPGLKPLANRFVWVALDTDRPENRAAVERLAPEVWPTFFVLSPDETIQARLLGAASVAQFRRFLIDGERTYLTARAGTGELDPLLVAASTGDRAATEGDLAAAERAYRQALDQAPADWPRRPDVLVSLITVEYRQKDWPGCLDLATAEHARTGRSASALDFATYASRCAAEAGPDRKDQVARLRQALIARLRDITADARAPLSADDRSAGLVTLRELHLAGGQTKQARQIAEEQLALLTEAAQKAPTPLAAMTYNWPRAEVHVFLERGAELIGDLEKSVADLPQEYDPPYRLAWVLHAIGEHDRALAAAEKARALVYGPRTARVLALIADIHDARGDTAAAEKARTAAAGL